MNHNGTSVNTKLSKPSTSGNKLYSVTPLPKSKVIPKVVKKNDLSKSVTSHLTTKKIIDKCIKVLGSSFLKIESEPINAASCPFTQSENEKWVPATSHKKNNKPYVDASRTRQTIKTITQKLVVKQNTRKSDNTMLPFSRRVSSTNASGSKPKSNTKNDRIPKPSSRRMKNKVEAHNRKFKSSANKNNHISDYNVNVKNVALLKNSDTICLLCNECLFSVNHDACVVQYLKKIQKHKEDKSAKQKVKSERKPTLQIFKNIGLKWIPTGKIFNLVGKPCPISSSNDTSAIVVPPGHILTTTVILVDAPFPKLSLRYVKAQESLSKCILSTESHPLNLRDFAIERILQDDELPPWKFDYLGVT
ncbi:hypothetical protein Tco_0175549 [Tanacetum coccineum]